MIKNKWAWFRNIVMVNYIRSLRSVPIQLRFYSLKQKRRESFYDVLNIPRNATKESIRTSYVKLCKEHHPDVASDPEANERFVEINRAYSTLIEPSRRQQYDIELYTAEAYRDTFRPYYSPSYRESNEAYTVYSTTHDKRNHSRVIVYLILLMSFATGVHTVRIHWAHKDYQRHSDEETKKNLEIYSKVREKARSTTVQEQLNILSEKHSNN